MNILLADDEGLVRAGLKSMLEELGMSLQVIGETRNGEETVQFVEEHRPDLVLVDIRMPKLSGLEAIAQGKILSPHTKWIILSGYSEFQYAQEALRLGACNYLLKPVSLDVLKDCLSGICSQHQQHIMERNQQMENMLVSLLNNKGSLNKAALSLPSAYAGGCICYVDSSLSEHDSMMWKRPFMKHLQDMLRSASLASELYLLTIALENETPSILWVAPPSLASKAATLKQELELSVQQWLKLEQNNAYTVTFVQLEECSSLDALKKQIEHVQTISFLRALQPSGGSYSVKEWLSLEKQTRLAGLAAQLEELCSLYRKKDYIGYSKAVAWLDKEMKELQAAHPDHQAWRHIRSFLACSLGISLSEQAAISSWIKALQGLGDQLVARTSREESVQKDIVQLVTAYVDQHYMHDIGIKQIAEEFQVTPNYLSALFHKKHGITFIKYLTQSRMLKAKELLLSDPNLKVVEVAEAVGYYSTRHFTKLFTEYSGCYPSEIRDKLG